MKVAYITSRFPETYETFVPREFAEAERQGLDFIIYSLKPCRDEVRHAEAAELLGKTRYAKSFGPAMIWRNFAAALLHPIAYFGLLFKIILRHPFKPRLLFKSAGGLALGAALAPELKRGGFTHIHAHWITVPATVAFAASRIAKIPFSITAHAWDIFNGDNLLRDKTRASEFVATCTNFNRKYMEKIIGRDDAKKIFLNYHGLVMSPAKPRSFEMKKPMSICSVGRLSEQKGFIYLLDALNILEKRGIDFTCIIAGEGPERPALERRVRELNLGGRVSMPGAVGNEIVRSLYEKSDVFVLPCIVTDSGDRDGIPNVLIEALAAKCPVVTTDISGIPELVENEVTGLAVPEKNPHAIARAVERLSRDSRLAKNIAEVGRRRVEDMFNLERNVAEFIQILVRHAKN